MALKLFELLGGNDRRFSPYCWRICMALAHKGLEADIVPCKFTDKHLFAFSGGQTVPVLQYGDKAVTDSWDIACYLAETYPDRPSLFSGLIGRGQARFISEWVPVWSRPMFMTVVKDVFDHIHQDDNAYFRESREKRFGKTLEELHAERDKHYPAIKAGLEPLRAVLQVQPYICGDAPAYGDYIVFGSFQMARSMSPYKVLEKGDIIYDWRKRMLDLYDGLGRSTTAYPE